MNFPRKSYRDDLASLSSPLSMPPFHNLTLPSILPGSLALRGLLHLGFPHSGHHKAENLVALRRLRGENVPSVKVTRFLVRTFQMLLEFVQEDTRLP
jgi:hypothetical protein